MEHNSADYLHTVVEAMKLAYADRDTYYADPAFVEMPGEGLLSKEYAQGARGADRSDARVARFSPANPLPFDSKVKDVDVLGREHRTTRRTPGSAAAEMPSRSAGIIKDTTHIAIIDKDGNVFDSTPSGGWISGGGRFSATPASA